MIRPVHSFLWLFPALLLTQCSPEPRLAAFWTDGCTGIPEQSPGGTNNWRECCVEHDIAYWKGGTEAERLAADERFRDCILRKTDNPRFADLAFRTVQRTGRPDLPTWYRWGYGWNYLRPAAPLTPKEQAMVTERLKTVDINPCTNCPKHPPLRGPIHR